MPPEVVIVAALGAIASGGVGALSAWLVFWAKSKDDKQELINQLQEERDRADDRADKDRTAAMEQIDKLWHDKAASREYVRRLLDHIWQRKDPPPPEVPDGYIH